MVITTAALIAWSKTVPPEAIFWIPDELWLGIWNLLAAESRYFGDDSVGYKYPLINIRAARLGRKSALPEYRRIKYKLESP